MLWRGVPGRKHKRKERLQKDQRLHQPLGSMQKLTRRMTKPTRGLKKLTWRMAKPTRGLKKLTPRSPKTRRGDDYVFMCHLDLQASALASKMFYHGLDLLASTLVGKPACHHADQHAGWEDLIASTLASKTS